MDEPVQPRTRVRVEAARAASAEDDAAALAEAAVADVARRRER